MSDLRLDNTISGRTAPIKRVPKLRRQFSRHHRHELIMNIAIAQGGRVPVPFQHTYRPTLVRPFSGRLSKFGLACLHVCAQSTPSSGMSAQISRCQDYSSASMRSLRLITHSHFGHAGKNWCCSESCTVAAPHQVNASSTRLSPTDRVGPCRRAVTEEMYFVKRLLGIIATDTIQHF